MLVAHGAPRWPAAQAAVAAQAEALRRRCHGEFAEIGIAFLGASPSPAEALAALRGDPACVVVVPMFMAAGHLARVALPRALAAQGGGDRCRLAGGRCRLAAPLGLAPELTAVIERRAVLAARRAGIVPRRSRLLLVGHGARHDAAPREAVRFHAERLVARRRFGGVALALIEEEPTVTTRLAACAGDMVVVGFFAAPGRHASGDVPQALAADPRRAERRLAYAGPVGAAPEAAAVIARLARAALARQDEG